MFSTNIAVEIGQNDDVGDLLTLWREQGILEKLPDGSIQTLAQVLKESRGLRDFLKDFGHVTVAEYFQAAFQKKSAVNAQLDSTVEAFQSALSRTGASVDREKLEAYFERTNLVGTGLHVGISSPWHFGSEVTTVAAAIRVGVPGYISLACGCIPLSNPTAPNGSWSNDDSALLGMRATPFNKLDGWQDALRAPSFSLTNGDAVPDYLKPLLHRQPAAALQVLGYQTCRVNRAIMDELLAGHAKHPFYHQAVLEDVVSEIIIQDLNSDGPLADLLLNKHYQHAALEEFEGLQGAWNNRGETSKGTDFFWRFKKADPSMPYSTIGKLVSLKVQGIDKRTTAFLSEPASPAEISLDKDTVIGLIHDRSIVPGVWMSMTALMTRGLAPVGGYAQINYLNSYIQKFEVFAHRMHDARFADFTQHVFPGIVLGLISHTSDGLPTHQKDLLEAPGDLFVGIAEALDQRSVCEAFVSGLRYTAGKVLALKT